LFYFQEQLNVTTESEIVVKLTASDAKSMSAEYGTAVRDLVAFYHWHFTAMTPERDHYYRFADGISSLMEQMLEQTLGARLRTIDSYTYSKAVAYLI
jgi:hypothetical protein